MTQKKRIDDYWNIDGSRDVSDPWTGFTQFVILEEKLRNRWSGRRLTRKQVTSRPDDLWPKLWDKMGKNAKLKKKQKWSHEKLHLVNARILRGIYFIHLEDQEFKETIKIARKKLETQVAPAMPCEITKRKKNCGNGAPKIFFSKTNQNLRVVWKPSARRRVGESLPTHHIDNIAGKGNSLQHYNLVHKFILCLKL